MAALLYLLAASAAVASALPGLPALGKPLACAPWAGKELCQTAVGITALAVTADGGGAMESPDHFAYGQFSLDMKLPKGNTGGVNFAWYVMDSVSPTNKDLRHSEIDMEFYGNKTEDTVMLALNVFCGGKQNLAQFNLPFNPSAAFHTYAMRWNPKQIVWLVDNIPIRILNRTPGMAWPLHAMKPQTSVWATPWTALKADFTDGPIVNHIQNFRSAGCSALKTGVAGAAACPGPWNLPLTPAQMAGYAKLHAASLIVDYGWDKA